MTSVEMYDNPVVKLAVDKGAILRAECDWMGRHFVFEFVADASSDGACLNDYVVTMTETGRVRARLKSSCAFSEAVRRFLDASDGAPVEVVV